MIHTVINNLSGNGLGLEFIQSKPLSRSTIWRRKRELLRELLPKRGRPRKKPPLVLNPKPTPGRKPINFEKLNSFMAWAGAAVTLTRNDDASHGADGWLTSEIMPLGDDGQRHYRATSEVVAKALRACPFHPAMLVTAICDTWPLGLHIRARMPLDVGSVVGKATIAIKRLQQSGAVLTEAMAHRELFRQMLKRMGYKQAELESTLDAYSDETGFLTLDGQKKVFDFHEAHSRESKILNPQAHNQFQVVGEEAFQDDGLDDIDARLGWKEPPQVQPSKPKTLTVLKKDRRQFVYTSPDKIDFIGGYRMTYELVKHWRRHRDFDRCREFVFKLCSSAKMCPPYCEKPQGTTAPDLNEAVSFWFRVRWAIRHGKLITDSMRTPKTKSP